MLHIDNILKKGLFAYSASLNEVRILFIVSVINNIITVLAPFFLIFVMSKIWFIYDTTSYMKLALCFFILGLLWFASSYIKDLIFFRMLLNFSSSISMETTKMLMNLPYSYIGNFPVESQYNRFMPLENLSYIWLNKILKPLLDLPLVIFSLLIICYILGFIYFSYVIFVLGIVFILSWYQNKNSEQNNSIDTIFHGNLKDYFSNIRLIQANKREDYFLRKSNELSESRTLNKYDNNISTALHDNIIESVLMTLYIASLGLAVYYALNGDLAIELLIIVLLLTWFSIAPLKQVLSVFYEVCLAHDIISQFRVLKKVNTSINRHKKIILKDNFNGDVELRSVNFKYTNGSNFYINNINLSIKRGEILLITGPSGSGKTTLLNLIMGLETPFSGFVRIDHDINLIDKESLTKHITFVSGTSYIDNLSILNNIMLSSNNKEVSNLKRNIALLEFNVSNDSNVMNKYLVKDYRNSKSDLLTYQDIVNKIILSKITPEIKNNIIIIDEPFITAKNKDFEKFVNLIQKIKYENTIIISSRYNFYHSIANKLLLLDDGKVQKYWGRG